MRLLVLAHDPFGPKGAKTGQSVIRYGREGWSGDEVVAVVDRAKAGGDAGDEMGEVARGIPIVASVEEGLRLGKVDGLVIGIAPAGGAPLIAKTLPEALRGRALGEGSYSMQRFEILHAPKR